MISSTVSTVSRDVVVVVQNLSSVSLLGDVYGV
jgi:hypothetical protein